MDKFMLFKAADREKYIRYQKAAVIVLTVLMFILFYRASFASYSNTDMPDHLKFAAILFQKDYAELSKGINSTFVGYMLYHLLARLISMIPGCSLEFASAVVLTGANLLTYQALLKLCRMRKIETETIQLWIFSLLFIVGLPLTGKLYLPQGSPSIWHNPTYIVSRPFSLLAFLQFCEIEFHGHTEKGDYLRMAGFLFLACFGKPSYTVLLLPAMAVCMIFDRIRARSSDIRGILLMAAAVAPTLGLLAFQYLAVFTDQVNSATNAVSVGIRFGTFLNIGFLKSIAALASIYLLPVLYARVFHGAIKDRKMLGFASAVSIFDAVQYFFLYQIGRNSGDFGWGYFLSIFVLYAVLFADLMQQENGRGKVEAEALLGLQMILGYLFFAVYFFKHTYFI